MQKRDQSPSASRVGDNAPVTTGSLGVIHETKFGGTYADISIEAFNALGFEFGDGVDVEFSSGYRLDNIPYYNGFYTQYKAPLISGYPGYPRIDICFNNGPDMFVTAGLDGESTVTITLCEKGKYKSVQDVFGLSYPNDISEYASAEDFANFREVKGGRLGKGLFYRSASPCDDTYCRASTVDSLIGKNGIGFIIDLADSEEETAACYRADSLRIPHWRKLYEHGRVISLDMTSAFRSDAYRKKAAVIMRTVLENDGPFLIHCTEGKDRTGFVLFVLSSLAGASLWEIEEDYMKTYACYYGVDKKRRAESYKAIKEIFFDDMALCLSGCDGIDGVTEEKLYRGAREYLMLGGMSGNEIDALILRICE